MKFEFGPKTPPPTENVLAARQIVREHLLRQNGFKGSDGAMKTAGGFLARGTMYTVGTYLALEFAALPNVSHFVEKITESTGYTAAIADVPVLSVAIVIGTLASAHQVAVRYFGIRSATKSLVKDLEPLITGAVRPAPETQPAK